MQFPNQIICPRCSASNLPFLQFCANCGQPLAPPPVRALPDAPPPPTQSDLPPLLWALACAFLALWGLVAAGPLRSLIGALTHPYLLLAWALISLIITGIFLAERVTKETPARALISTREIMALSWTAAALLGAGQLVKFIIPAMPVITRYEVMSKASDGCRVEVYLRGEEGDELWRLTGLNRHSEKEVVGVIVRRPGGGSAKLPMTHHTPDGECAIARYHLIVNGKETDHVDAAD